MTGAKGGSRTKQEKAEPEPALVNNPNFVTVVREQLSCPDGFVIVSMNCGDPGNAFRFGRPNYLRGTCPHRLLLTVQRRYLQASLLRAPSYSALRPPHGRDGPSPRLLRGCAATRESHPLFPVASRGQREDRNLKT